MTPSSKTKWLVLTGIGIVLIAFVWIFFPSGSAESPHGIGSVKRETLVQKITIAGNIVPNRSTVVTAPFTGYVRKLFVKVGDKIKPGDPLVSLAQSLQSQETSFPLRAPFPGVVVNMGKTEGQLAKENDANDFILRVDDLTKLFVNANAPESDWVKIKAGMEAVVRAAPVQDRTYKGVIRDIALAAKTEENNWRSSSRVEYPIRLEILDFDKQLSPGMTAVIDIIANKKENVLTLPHEFIRREEEKFYVEMADGKRRDITVGLQNEEAAEIVTGLKEGEKVKQIDFASLLEE